MVKTDKKSASVYAPGPKDGKVASHTLAVLVTNEPGVLARVIGLFAGRGYNIESLTVAETDHAQHLSRITIVVSGTPMVIEQIKAQLGRLVPVRNVRDLTTYGPHIEREVVLIKFDALSKKRDEAFQVAKEYGAKTLAESQDPVIFELTGTAATIDEFIERMRMLGMLNVSRTGIAAISCDKSTMEDED
jgi:acetolactate synthase-1/3 small subunit